jgi:hypothetical protein
VERTVNLYLEAADSGTGKTRAGLYGSPGIHAWAQLGTGPIRSMFFQNGRGYLVSGAQYFELFANRTAILRGSVFKDGNPACIASNGTAGLQNYIVTGGLGYIHALDTNVFTQITDPDFPNDALIGLFLDGYFAAFPANSTQWHLSNLNDGLAWDGLDIFQRLWGQDNIVSAITNHRELWILGSQTSEVWVNTGATSILEPLQGVFIESGSAAPFGVAQADNTIWWIEGDSRGSRIIRRANGYTPERVSTHAVEVALNEVESVENAIAFPFQMEGHLFICWYLPEANTTWTLDANTRQWVEFADWNPDRYEWEPWTPRAHARMWDRHLFGDRQSGVVYDGRLDYYGNVRVVA